MISLAFLQCLKPPPKLDLVEWADTYRFLPDNSAESGRWKTSRVEAARQPMLSISDPDVKEVTIMCAIQFMKALDVTTPILTVKGWSTMGDLVEGDLVFAPDGKPYPVIGKSEVRYGYECYSVAFSDGSIINCDAGHKWQVVDAIKGSRVIDTLEMSNSFKCYNGNRYSIPVTKPLIQTAKSLVIDPYVLGCWLGDGHSYSAGFTSSKQDSEIVNEIVKRGYVCETKKVSVNSGDNTLEFKIENVLPKNECAYGHKLEKGIRCRKCAVKHSSKVQKSPNYKNRVNKKFYQNLKELNLIDNKHIPDIYFKGSFNQRLDLLQGLMDTDGTIGKKGNTSFTQKSESVTNDFMRLCWGLGLKPKKAKVRNAFIVTFTSYSDMPIFKLERKRKRLNCVNSPNVKVKESRSRRIVNVSITKSIPVQCIAINSPDHLYLAGESLIATHNTELMLNTAMYYMHQEPSPIIYVAPKKETAEAWSKERLVKSVNATPVVADIFTNNRRGEGNTITQKQYAGGQISIVSARNPTDLAMRACRIVLLDEIDKYPFNVGSGESGSGGEGDPIAVVWGRATTYGDRAKKVSACSPTIEGKSRIKMEYDKSNKSVFNHVCPHCDHAKVLTWTDVRIPRNKKGKMVHEGAAIVCTECGTEWNESDRHKAIRNHFWVATEPTVTWHHGYKASSLCSPFTPVETLAKEFIDAQGSQESLKAFYNTRMSETWKEVGERPEWRKLYERRENYKVEEIPDGALLITCGIDVQKTYITYEVVGYGRRKESWSIEEGVIDGKMEDDDLKEKLTKFLERTYKNSMGMDVPIMKTCIDSGYNTQEVYAFVRSYGSDTLIAVKGGNDSLKTVVGTPTPVDVNINGKRISRGLMLWHVGSSVIKEQLYRWFGANKPTDEQLLANDNRYPSGYSHFPMYSEEFFKQMTAEQYTLKVDNKGFHTYVWENMRKDNHKLDCRVYARAAAAMLQIDRMSSENWLELQNIYFPVKKTDDKPTGRRKGAWIKR